MKKTFIIVMTSILPAIVWAHCQMPCGIYDDAGRILSIGEHVTTIEKAMGEVRRLSGKNDAQSLNQITRWINTKEIHAQKIQDIVSAYFLTQRVKQKQKKDKNYSNYVSQVTVLQQILVSAMKCKQTVDSDYAISVQQLLDQFVDLYFDEHGKKHLKDLKS